MCWTHQNYVNFRIKTSLKRYYFLNNILLDTINRKMNHITRTIHISLAWDGSGTCRNAFFCLWSWTKESEYLRVMYSFQMLWWQCSVNQRQETHKLITSFLCVLGGVKTSPTKPFSPKVQRELEREKNTHTHTELLKFMCAAQLHSRCQHN